MITLVILNWKRPNNIKNNILPYLCQNNLITEIIISHNNLETIFDYNHPKIVHINDVENNKKIGLAVRFTSAMRAKNDIILMIDDDVYPQHELVHFLLKKYLENSQIIHGIFGRNIIQNMYFPINATGKVDIALTQCIMFNKKWANIFLKEKSMVEDITLKAKPIWNGEDIFLSLLVLKYTGQQNMAYKDHSNQIIHLDDNDSISNASLLGSVSHIIYRNKLANEIKKRYNITYKYDKRNLNIKILFVISIIIVVTIYLIKNKKT